MPSVDLGPPDPRSYLYVPADQAGRLAKASSYGADALILDLEDSVHHSRKAVARTLISDWLTQSHTAKPTVWIRINPAEPSADVSAISRPVAGVILPKADPDRLAELDRVLLAHEHDLALAPGSLHVIGLVETASGLISATEIASHDRIERLAIGRADLAGELGLRVDPDGPELRGLMLQLVVASSAAGLAAPVAPTSTDFRDLDALRETTAAMDALGFRGRTAIHPAQIPVINAVFTPTPEEVEAAQQLIDGFTRAQHKGAAVTVDSDGRMVDAAVIRTAAAILQRARHADRTR